MNVLLINADQLRHDCVGYRGLRRVITPNLDALAQESCVFTSAYTPLPVCAPARQALISGRHPDSFGASWNYDFLPTPELNPEWCWPLELRARGVRTGYLGRFHVSATRAPHDFGYDEFVDKREYTSFIKQKYPNLKYEGGWLGCESPLPYQDGEAHWMARRAADMIDHFARAGTPWHIWVDIEIPHLPCRPSKPFSNMYDPAQIEPWDGWGDDFTDKPYIHKQQVLSWGTQDYTWADAQSMVARYFGWISQLDDAVGNILSALKRSGQWDDTAVIFTSDHGDMCLSHSMLDKHYVMYDDIIRVPLIVKAPALKPRTCDAFVMNCLDIPASIRKWMNLSPDPAAHGRALPESELEDAGCPDEVVTSSNGQQFGLFTTRALRGRRFKYVWNLTDIDEFYDLEMDAGEKVNLIRRAEHAQTISDMRKRLCARLNAHGDPFARSEWTRRQLLEGAIHLPDRTMND